jgi:hypothetical protein
MKAVFMEYCLITDEVLDSSTKLEHTILHSLGGRITSRRVISSTFNQMCGSTIDMALTDVFKHIFGVLVPAIIKSANPGNVPLTSLDKKCRYYLRDGFTTLAQPVVIKDDGGKPSGVYAPTLKSANLFAKSTSLPIISIDFTKLPVNNDKVYRRCRLLDCDVEIAVIKCIFLTLDEMTARGGFPRIARRVGLKKIANLLNNYVIANQRNSQELLQELSQIYFGIQLRGRETIAKILNSNSVTVHPFDHIIVISGDVSHKTIDALWSIAGIEVHGVRLCSEWEDFDFTCIIQNSILKNSDEPRIIYTECSAGLLCKEHKLRSIQSAQDGNDIEPDILYMISKNRQVSYMEALLYVEKKCDEHVFKEFFEPTRYDPSLTVRQVIHQRLSCFFGNKNTTEVWNKMFEDEEPTWVTMQMNNIKFGLSTWNDILQTYRNILEQFTEMDTNPDLIFTQEIHTERNN